MDAISNALTGAWLEAVRRVQSTRPPVEPVTRDERTLTDAMEAALRHGGLDSQDAQWADPAAPVQAPDPDQTLDPGQMLDLRV
jgi:hypothetical protein